MTNKFNIEKSLGEIDFNEIINNVSKTLAIQCNKKTDDIKNAVCGWVVQETQNEEEAYTVTLSVLENSKFDPQVRASRILNRDIYSYINKTLKKQNF